MIIQSPNPPIDERIRIQQAYAKRKGNPKESFFSPALTFMIQGHERQILEMLKLKSLMPLSTTAILEIGCGDGFWLREFMKWGAQPQNLFGVELLLDRVYKAKRLSTDDVHISCGNATCLSFQDASFDLVHQSLVFSSVLDFTIKRQIASEMLRVVRSDGQILWYDFHVDNPSNPDVKGVRKGEIAKLFPNCQIELWKVSLAPPIVRMLAPYSLLACHILERCKIFNTHYVGIIRKP